MRTSNLLLLASIALFSSCASYEYVNTAEQRSNTSFQLNTNLPGATVEILSGKNGRARLLGTLGPNQNSSTFSLGRLRFSGNYIRIGGSDYESVVQKIKITPRGKAIKNDLYLGIFTYFTPFLIDPFRSDFYKIREDYKTITVNLEFNQTYMYRKFTDIAHSTDPAKFRTYIEKYPNSNFKIRAKDKIDSLELNTALLSGTEEALEAFIQSHEDAKTKFLIPAQQRKGLLLQARMDYEKILTKTDLNEFKNYLKTYPNFKQSTLAVKRSYEIATTSKSLDKLLEFNKDIFIPYQSVLDIKEKQQTQSGLNNAVDLAIIREKTDMKDPMGSFIKIWNTAQDIYGIYPNISDLPLSRYYQSIIADQFLTELSRAKTRKEQDALSAKYNSLVKNYNLISVSEFFVVSCLHFTQSFSGELKLINQGIFANYLEHSSEGDPLKNLWGILPGDIEEIGIQKGEVTKFKLFESSKPIASFEKQPDGTLYYARYENGQLAKEEFYNYSKGVNYFYAYENGKNQSLEALNLKISQAESVLKGGNYTNAKRLLTTECKNSYPLNVAQNVKIQNLIAECDKQEKIAQELAAKAEAVRADEIRKQIKLQWENFTSGLGNFTWTMSANGITAYINFEPITADYGIFIVWTNFNNCKSSYNYRIDNDRRTIYTEGQFNTCGQRPVEIGTIDMGFAETQMFVNVNKSRQVYEARSKWKPK
ncbi:MAG: hypothetical protein VKN72_16815 [Nostocales cyanobacterium 94392]|nr:hypothetical protein [Nostocales cyanobacterium 94392]